MLILLELNVEIAKAQRQLEATIRRDFSNTAKKNIGYPGGVTRGVEVYTDNVHWFWSADSEGEAQPNPRRLNWFGLFQNDSDLHISVEINTPYEGRNKQIAGFFARDNMTGTIYLMHSGRVGGGTRGVGKSAFLSWSSQPLVEVFDSVGEMRHGVFVMPIKGKAATRSAKLYLEAIVQFKQAVRNGETKTPEAQREQKEFEDYYEESRGRRKGKRSVDIDYVSRHGDVVTALHSWRRSLPFRSKSKIIKNVKIDLGVAIDQDIIEVYEVKTSSGRFDIYAAIGQLMVHGNTKDCQKTIVLPHDEPIIPELASALQRLGIQLLKFKLDEVKASIA